MKSKLFSILLAAALVIGMMTGCVQSDAASFAPEVSNQPVRELASSVASVPETMPESVSPISQAPQTMQIRVSANGQSIVFQLNDSSAAKSLYQQLPLSIDVENYGSNEKIFYPPEKLDTSDTPLLSRGDAGTLGYYAPWGDVVIYYESCGPASGLYVLGTVVSGADQIESLSGTIQIDVYNAS